MNILNQKGVTMPKINLQDLEDAYQTAELKLLRLKLKYPENTIKSVRAFKNAVAHNYLADMLRSRYRLKRKRDVKYKLLPFQQEPVLNRLIDTEETIQFNNAVAQLSPREQFVLKEILSGVRVKDISAGLALHPDHVSVILQRAKVKISRILGVASDD